MKLLKRTLIVAALVFMVVGSAVAQETGGFGVTPNMPPGQGRMFPPGPPPGTGPDGVPQGPPPGMVGEAPPGGPDGVMPPAVQQGPHGVGGGMPGANAEEMKELVQTVMAARMGKELGLSEEETVVMLHRLGAYRDRMDALGKERERLMQALREALNENASEEVVLTHLKELVQFDAQAGAKRVDYLRDMQKGLSPKQSAKMYVFLSDFEEHMRNMIQRARHGGANMGGQRPGVNRPQMSDEQRERWRKMMERRRQGGAQGDGQPPRQGANRPPASGLEVQPE